DFVKGGYAASGVPREGLEAIPVGGEKPMGKVPRDAVEGPGDRVVLVTAYNESADFFPEVHEEIRVAHHRKVPRDLAWRGEEVLVLHGDDRDRHTDHSADVPGPDPGGADDDGGADRPGVGHHSVHTAIPRGDVGNFRAGIDLAASVPSAPRERVGQIAGVD